MNTLIEFFEKGDHRIIDKWMHYFDIYERHLSDYRGKRINILEIGISHGGSLQMWKEYFGEGSTIYGVDINPECKKFEEDGIKIFIGSQSDKKFLKNLIEKIPKPDILIDDGGHMMKQQIITFEELFGYVKDKGIYICEDLHTSYWISHGGGYKRKGTFIEFSKNLIDKLNAWHSHQKNLIIDDKTKNIYGLHYYDSILVIEKREINRPFSKRTGTPSIEEVCDQDNRKSIGKVINNYYEALLAKIRIASRL
ncbi:MAG TPA: hypothetical protein VMV77_05015 [Bacteroidales bacterium]|nr:hypothetical protein [Bacteroidales bacterium]